MEYFENLVEFVFDEDITEGDNDLEVMLKSKKNLFFERETLEKTPCPFLGIYPIS